MSDLRDWFRPRVDPAKLIYDALVSEAEYRDMRTPEEWIEAERKAVWRAAVSYAKRHGLRQPTMEDIETIEQDAMGHIDYAAKIAWGLSRKMTQ